MALLEVKSLSKSYGAIKAVDNVSFAVNRGDVIGLLGPNGAGKSTTISMIATLMKPDLGQILYKGQDISSSPRGFQKELGVVPQEIALYPSLSGYDNLRFWGRAYGLAGKALDERIEKVAEIIGIKERLRDKVDEYSGGMKRRLNIGAALLHEPEILIMDEPTVGIDPQTRNHILDTVLELNRSGMTIIYTSHYMEEVEYLCRYIYIMDSGRVIASGTQDELVDSADGQRQLLIQYEEIDENLLEKLGAIEGITSVTSSETQVRLAVDNGKKVIRDVFDVSMKAGALVESVEAVKPNLETVFLQLTGKALRD